MFCGDGWNWLVDVIAGERFFNLRLLRVWLHIVDEAKYERSENRKKVLKQKYETPGFYFYLFVFRSSVSITHPSINMHCLVGLVIIWGMTYNKEYNREISWMFHKLRPLNELDFLREGVQKKWLFSSLLLLRGGSAEMWKTTRLFYKLSFCWSVPVWFWTPKTCFTLGLECFGHIYSYQNSFESSSEMTMSGLYDCMTDDFTWQRHRLYDMIPIVQHALIGLRYDDVMTIWLHDMWFYVYMTTT